MKSLYLIGLLTLLVACSGVQAIDRNQLNSSISINYGIVNVVERVSVKSEAPKGAVMGGILGAATSSKHKRGKHALEGALIGGLLSAIVEGKHKAYSYQIGLTNGQEVKVITEQGDIRQGDCVSFEQGRTSNVRRVSNVYCEHHQHEVMQDSYVVSSSHFDAAQCHAAKQQALEAQTEQLLDVAVKKVKIFCD